MMNMENEKMMMKTMENGSMMNMENGSMIMENMASLSNEMSEQMMRENKK